MTFWHRSTEKTTIVSRALHSAAEQMRREGKQPALTDDDKAFIANCRAGKYGVSRKDTARLCDLLERD